MSSSKARILMVGPFPPPSGGGVATFMLNVMGSYLAEHYEFFRFTTSRPEKKNVIDNTRYGALFNAGFGRLILGGLVTIWHLIIFPLVLIRRRIDIVQIHSSAWMTFWESAIYLVAARFMLRPTLMRLGGETDEFFEASSPWIRRIIKWVILWPHVLIVQSEYWRSFITRLGRVDKVIVLNNFVDETWLNDPNRLQNNVPVFLFSAGSEAKRKGVFELLDVISLLANDGISARFRIVAAPSSLMEEIADRGLKGKIELVGFLSRDEMREEFDRCDVFLLPSHAEGFPNALLEAMARGVPTIVTSVGAMPEIVDDEIGGYIVQAGNTEQLKARITDLALDKKRREEMGQYNKRRVKEKYTAAVVLPNLESAYVMACGG